MTKASQINQDRNPEADKVRKIISEATAVSINFILNILIVVLFFYQPIFYPFEHDQTISK